MSKILVGVLVSREGGEENFVRKTVKLKSKSRMHRDKEHLKCDGRDM